jgi:Helix-turn-helix domain
MLPGGGAAGHGRRPLYGAIPDRHHRGWDVVPRALLPSSPHPETSWVSRRVEPTAEFAQLQLGFVDRTQWRYEVIRPLVLFADRTAQQRAHETHTHPDTVRALQRRFRQHGILGLLPESVEVMVRKRATRIPEAVRLEIDRLKALYEALQAQTPENLRLAKTTS